MVSNAPATLVLIAQNPRLGGAERSLCEWFLRKGERPHILAPAVGEWEALARKHGWGITVVPLPQQLAAFSWRGRVGGKTSQGKVGGKARSGQNSDHSLLRNLALVSAVPELALQAVTTFAAAFTYARRLAQALRQPAFKGLPVRTLGAKSHALGLLLLPALRGRWHIDVRDFLQPPLLRSIYAWVARRGWARIITNSRAVAADYGGTGANAGAVEVVYPRIALAREPRPAQEMQEAHEGQGSLGRRIITHVAYFAPYKGQDLFLEFAAACLQGGLHAEFWLVGEVLYPAPEYVAYAERLRARACEPDLAGRVKFWGGLRAPQVQGLLEQSHLLVHCTHEPEPFGRTLIEALLCGCEVVAHRGSGACEVARVVEGLPAWLPEAAQAVLGSGVGGAKPYVSLERSNALSALAEVSPDAMVDVSVDVLVDGEAGDAALRGR